MRNNKLLYCFLLLPLFLIAQNVEINLVQQKEQYLPGNAHSLVFSVLNNQQTTATFTPEIRLPHQWKSTTTPVQTSLQPGQSTILIFPVHIPSSTLSKNYEITLALLSEQSATTEVRFNLHVAEVHKVVLTPHQSPDFVKAGDTIISTFILRNEGNSLTRLRYEINQESLIRNDIPNVLQPGEMQVVEVVTPTNANLPKSTGKAVRLTIEQLDVDAKPIKAYARTTVIPIEAQQEDVYHRFPVRVSGMYIGRNRNDEYADGFQGEVYGKGTLDAERKKHIEFRAIGPDRFSLAVFGRYEEYFITYSTDRLYAHLGDKVYSASYLTEFARYGRGAEINYETEKFAVGGYYQKPRFIKDLTDQFHGFVAYKFNENTRLTSGYLLKTFNDQPNVNLMFLTADTNLFGLVDLHGEYAGSDSQFQNGHAFRIQATTNIKNFLLNASYLEASPQFQGFFTNTNFVAANMRYRIHPKINLIANYRKDARNINQDTLFMAAPYSERFLAGVNYKYAQSGAVRASVGKHKKMDRMEIKRFDYEEDFLRINFMQRFNDFRFNLQSQLGQTNNFLNDTYGNSQMHTLNVTYNRWKNSFNLFGSYLNSNRYADVKEEQFVFGGRFSGNLTPKTHYSLFYQNTYLIEEYFRDRNFFELQLTQFLAPNQSIDVIGRYNIAQGQTKNKDLAFSVRYTLQLNLPLYKTKEYSTLKGRISNIDAQHIEGVRLYLNNHEAVSDKFGNFTFVDVAPGPYFLELDKTSIGIREIPTMVMPMRIEITEKEHFVDFGLTRAATISGIVQLTREERINNGKPENESVIVEISDGKEVFRKVCRAGEPFDFTYLRPGVWRVKVYRNGLNKHYQINNSEFTVELLSGQEYPVVIEVFKQQREIKYLQEPLQIQAIKPKPKK